MQNFARKNIPKIMCHNHIKNTERKIFLLKITTERKI